MVFSLAGRQRDKRKTAAPKGRRSTWRNPIELVLDRRADEDLAAQTVVGSREGVTVSGAQRKLLRADNGGLDIKDVVDAGPEVDALTDRPVAGEVEVAVRTDPGVAAVARPVDRLAVRAHRGGRAATHQRIGGVGIQTGGANVPPCNRHIDIP